MENLLLVHYQSSMRVTPFDNDKELPIELTHSDGRSDYMYLSLNEVNDLISYLVSQLQEVGEPVEILTQK